MLLFILGGTTAYINTTSNPRHVFSGSMDLNITQTGWDHFFFHRGRNISRGLFSFGGGLRSTFALVQSIISFVLASFLLGQRKLFFLHATFIWAIFSQQRLARKTLRSLGSGSLATSVLNVVKIKRNFSCFLRDILLQMFCCNADFAKFAYCTRHATFWSNSYFLTAAVMFHEITKGDPSLLKWPRPASLATDVLQCGSQADDSSFTQECSSCGCSGRAQFVPHSAVGEKLRHGRVITACSSLSVVLSLSVIIWRDCRGRPSSNLFALNEATCTDLKEDGHDLHAWDRQIF